MKYSDIIQPDDSLEKLIKQMEKITKQYGTMVNAIKSGANRIVEAVKSASGATSDGRKAIEEAADAATRLEQAEKELAFAMSEIGQRVAELKARTQDQNKETVQSMRYAATLATSYDRLQADLKAMVSLYKSMTEAERSDSEAGQILLNNILGLKDRIKALDDTMKPHIETMSRLQKAQQELAYLQSAEGQKLLDVKARIRELNAARQEQKQVLSEVEKLQQKLEYMQSEEGQEAAALKQKITELSKARQASEAPLSEVEKLQQRLIYLQSEEGQKAISLKQQISELSGTRRDSAVTAAEIEKLQQRLAYLQSEEGQEVIALKQKIAELSKARRDSGAPLSEVEKLQQRLIYLQSEEGQETLALRQKIAEVSKARRDSGTPMTEVEKLQQRLIYLQSEEGQKAIALKQRIAEVIQARKQQLSGTQEVSEADRRLQKAEQELAFALSDVGKKVAELKAKTKDANASTIEQQRLAEAAAGSYNRIKTELKDLMSLWKSLSREERVGQFGKDLTNEIQARKRELYYIGESVMSYTTGMTEVEKAEQRLIYLQSEEGQKLLGLRAQINELTRARQKSTASIDPLAQAHQRLAYALSDEYKQKVALTAEAKQAEQVSKYEALIANSAEGSYNRLAAQYALNKIRLNAMSQAEREATASGRALEAETALIHEKMVKLQEATGNYTLSVGNYKTAWSGLGFSVAQVVRELPAAAVSLNTFFLGISNNVPIVIDEIRRLRAQNAKFAAEGKPTVSVTREIVKALFSWNTALVVLLSVFSMYGKQIVEWVASLFKARAAAISMDDALSNLAKELEKTNGGYGDHIVTLKQLQETWKSLKTDLEKKQFIRDNADEFKNLGVAVNGVTDAENVLIKNTQAVIEALRLRAKAAAAQKLAEEQYEKALTKQNEAETAEKQGPSPSETGVASYFAGAPATATALSPGEVSTAEYVQALNKTDEIADQLWKKRISNLKDEAKAAEATADAYFKLSAGYEAEAKDVLKDAGISEYHKKDKDRAGSKEPKDLTDTIYKNQIKARKSYEESVTALQQDEFAKRRKTAADEVQNENDKLREMLRKNEEYLNNVGGKYKELTAEQKQMIAEQNAWLSSAIANNLKSLELQIEKIQREQAVSVLQRQRELLGSIDYEVPGTESSGKTGVLASTDITVNRDVSYIEQSLVRERQLLEQNLNAEYALILKSNQKLLDAGDEYARSESDIIAEFGKKRVQLYAEYDKKVLDQRAQDNADQLALVKKGTEEELALLIKQNEIQRALALAENAAKPAAQQVSSSVINAKYDKSKSLAAGSFELSQFDERQKLDEAVFNQTRHNESQTTVFKLQQEKERWEKQIALAESGGLDWSQTQIDTAKATIKGIEREMDEATDFVSKIGQKGVGTTLLEGLGFDDDQISAIQDATSIIIEQIQAIIDAEVEAAEAAVEAAEARVEAAQSAYDAEVEARNNGYANNVATAKKELQQEKKNQAAKQKLLEQAQRRQEAVNTVIQTSSLVTAAANLWASLSSIPIIGHTLALAAIATMFTSFAVAKVRAAQVTSSADTEYGEGGLEFLSGGSHASGNDIDLKTKNKKGRNMRAEGGEAMAIINKRQTRKYRKVLPDIVDSLNRGVFEEKYLGAFKAPETIGLQMAQASQAKGVDLSALESDVRGIRKQGETKCYSLADGTVIMQYKNVKRIIRR